MASFSSLLEELARAHEREVKSLQIELQNLRLNNATRDSGVESRKGASVPEEPEADASVVMTMQSIVKHSSIASSEAATFSTSRTPITTPTAAAKKSILLDSLTSLKYKKVNKDTRSTTDALFPALTFHGDQPAKSCWVACSEEINCQTKSARSILQSPSFDVAILVLIILNSILMCLETQYEGFKIGHRIGYQHFSDQDSAWRHLGGVFDVSEKIFLTLFTIEIVIRMIAFRTDFVFHGWNWLDLIVVLVGILDWIAPHAFEPKMFRLLRLLKVARTLRSLRTSKFTNALHFLLTSISASGHILFWSLCVMFVIQSIFALLLCEVLAIYFDDKDGISKEAQAVFVYAGTFTRTLVTMYEVLIGNWAVPCRVFAENISEELCGILLLYRCVCGFAVVNVIGAVFIQQTMKTLSQDSDMMVMERSRIEAQFKRRLEKLFVLLETHDGTIDEEGKISMREVSERLTHPEVQLECMHLGIEIHDLEDLLTLFTGQAEGITVDEFIHAAHSVRKQANTMDIARVLMHSRSIQKQLRKLMSEVHRLRQGQGQGQGNANGCGSLSEGPDNVYSI